MTGDPSQRNFAIRHGEKPPEPQGVDGRCGVGESGGGLGPLLYVYDLGIPTSASMRTSRSGFDLSEAEGYPGRLRAMCSWSSEDRLWITMPTLVIHSGSYHLVPGAERSVLAECIPAYVA
jgi:hypothetical protein